MRITFILDIRNYAIRKLLLNQGVRQCTLSPTLFNTHIYDAFKKWKEKFSAGSPKTTYAGDDVLMKNSEYQLQKSITT